MNGTYYKARLVDGVPVIIPIYTLINGAIPPNVWAKPTGGDTVTVDYSLDGATTWETPITTTTVNWSDTIVAGMTHVRFTRSAGTGTTSTVGVC